MSYAFSLPALPTTIQQLASVLPLTALVEFIDLPTKLHVFHLTGRISLWNWPITPAGARLLLQTYDNGDACCLDSFDRSATLHCIDGRFGDLYPSSTPTTTRLWLAGLKSSINIPNLSVRMRQEHVRQQRLEVIVLTNTANTEAPTSPGRVPFWRTLLKIGRRPVRYRLLSATGWVLWAFAVAVSLATSLYISAAYLLLLPLSGLTVRYTHGGEPRRLLDARATEYKRVVVAANSLNGSEWWLFYGGSPTVNSLLNKPLNRAGRPARRYVIMLLQVLILGQWTLAVGSCALQDWNAVIVSLWLAFCSFSSAYLYSATRSVRDWRELDCGIEAKKITAEFSSRRSMLGAMVYLNPDTNSGSLSWMNPILAPCEERTQWETALLKFIQDGSFGDKEKREYWHEFIEESVEMGRKIEKVIKESLGH